MSHYRVKTTYNQEGSYGRVETKTLYAWHNNSCDIVCFYDEYGKCLFCIEDTMHNNLLDAVNRLYAPHKREENEYILEEGVEYMTPEEVKKIIDK